MQIAPPGTRQFRELADKRQDRIADSFGFLLQARRIEPIASARQRVGRMPYGLDGLGRDDPEPSLGACKRRFDLDAAHEECVIAENLPHRGGSEHVGENSGIESADCHEQVT